MHLQKIIEAWALTAWFQPIIELRSGSVAAYEGLIRGPALTQMEEPRALFAVAERDQCLGELERACWSVLLSSAAAQRREGADLPLLFMNVLPDEVGDRSFFAGVLDELERVGIPPAEVVLEITEGTRVEDYATMLRNLARYRAEGFRVAVDDAGAGHSGLQLIAEIEPDYVKLDRGLVDGVHRHSGRLAALESMVLFSEKMGFAVVAEGIEREEDLQVVRAMNIPYAQGFLIGRPDPKILPPRSQSLELLRVGGVAGLTTERPPRLDLRAPIGDLVQPAPSVDRTRQLRDVLDVFSEEGVDAVVLLDHGRPFGLASRRRVHELLARPYGREVFLPRAIERVADCAPLIVDWRARPETISRLAMGRSRESLYDDIIVTRGSEYFGVVSVHRLLDAITDSRLETARHSNPLTGLPGNHVIQEVVRGRLQGPAGAAVLHIDLDNFKGFNDNFGFHRGDDAIRATASLLQEVVGVCGGPNAFLGHVGGDDFIAIVSLDAVDRLRESVTKRFPDRLLSTMSMAGDRPDAALTPETLPGVTLAVVLISGDDPRSPEQVLHSLAAAKRQAKARGRDRESPLREVQGARFKVQGAVRPAV